MDMPEISKEIIVLLQYLLPGFLVAWVFYSFTAHAKPNQFERVVQALIFSLVVKIVTTVFMHFLYFIGRWYSLGKWTIDSELVSSVTLAILLGILFSTLSNTGKLHAVFRKFSISKSTGGPSEWHYALNEYPRYITLHLKDERRVYGWPEAWPTGSEKGHFFLVHPSWLCDGETAHELNSLKGLLVSVKDVRWIEFSKAPGEDDDK